MTLFGLLATIMYFEVVGGLQVYQPYRNFHCSTPVVWIAGFRIYKGAYMSLKNRNVNMDVLVTVGVLAGLDIRSHQSYSCCLQLTRASDYLEIAIGILAFVLLGKYIEELIRRRSAASIRKLLNSNRQWRESSGTAKKSTYR